MIVLDNSFVEISAGGSNAAMSSRACAAASPDGAPDAPPATSPDAQPLWALCTAGALSLVVAMGIGRFAFTPLLPLMQRAGQIGADAGALLAAANYAGYLLGALTAARLPGTLRARVLAALMATAGLTAASGWLSSGTGAMALRLAAGAASAWALVGISSWAVPALANRGRPEAGGWVFAGVGLGIALAGTWVWAGAAQGADRLWLQLGLLAAGLTVVVACLWRTDGAATSASPVEARADGQPDARPPGSAAVVLCYGLMGFGYILPATYLPALARALIDDPARFGLVWPVFGLAAAASTLLAGRALKRWHRRQLWAASHGLMAAGCAVPLLSHSGPALALSALLVGGTFMVATMAGLQQARALAPARPGPLLARLTTAFAIGQIAGPLLALGFSRLWPALGSGIEATLALAALALAASAIWLHRSRLP